MSKRNIWKEHFPIHFFFFLVALIGFWKSQALWGFIILGVSIAFTAGAFFLERRLSLKGGKETDRTDI
jgi:hypothetical protein